MTVATTLLNSITQSEFPAIINESSLFNTTEEKSQSGSSILFEFADNSNEPVSIQIIQMFGMI